MKKVFLICLLMPGIIWGKGNKNDKAEELPTSQKFRDLVEEAGGADDSATACRLAVWITDNIAWDVRHFNTSKAYYLRSTDDILKTKTGSPAEYARLFKNACDELKIPAMVIEGYEKNELYENGAGFYQPNHAWNAVYYNGAWHIFDLFNASGELEMKLKFWKKMRQAIQPKKILTSTKFSFLKKYQPEYIDQDVEEVRLTRLPVDPIWQLTDTLIPLSDFEKEKSDINEFNEKYSHPKIHQNQLLQYAAMKHDEYILDCADRTYAFNPRYTGMKAEKHISRGNELIRNAKEQMTISEMEATAGEFKKEYNVAKDLLKIERKEIAQKYAELKKVNNDKKVDVSRYKQKIETPNNSHISRLESKISTMPEKIKALEKDNQQIEEKIEKPLVTINSNRVATAEAPSAVFDKLDDSIQLRQQRIALLQDTATQLTNSIQGCIAMQNTLVDSLKQYIVLSTDAFNSEIKARSANKDSYDDTVRQIRTYLQEYKVERLDGYQKQYLDNHDSILRLQTHLKRVNMNIGETGKNSVKDITFFKQQYQTDVALEKVLRDAETDYEQALQHMQSTNTEVIGYMKSHRSVMKGCMEVYQDQNRFVNGLDKNDEARKKHVKKMLDREQKTANNINERWKEGLVKTNKSMDASVKRAKERAKQQQKKNKA